MQSQQFWGEVYAGVMFLASALDCEECCANFATGEKGQKF
jgi:hypothetical protein